MRRNKFKTKILTHVLENIFLIILLSPWTWPDTWRSCHMCPSPGLRIPQTPRQQVWLSPWTCRRDKCNLGSIMHEALQQHLLQYCEQSMTSSSGGSTPSWHHLPHARERQGGEGGRSREASSWLGGLWVQHWQGTASVSPLYPSVRCSAMTKFVQVLQRWRAFQEKRIMLEMNLLSQVLPPIHNAPGLDISPVYFPDSS